MIAYLEGHVLFVETGHVVVKVNGVGYHVIMSKKNIETITVGTIIELFVHTHVREDILELYGFSSPVEKQVFLLLVSVTGIGPKLAHGMLSALAPYDIINAVINKDIAMLSSIPGIGKKTAERLALELKEKAVKMPLSEQPIKEETIRVSLEHAIRGLGYSKSESDRALRSLDQHDLDTLPLETLIKKTLNLLVGASHP